MGSEQSKYTEKSSNIPEVTDTLYFMMLYGVHLTMGSETYKCTEKSSSIHQVTYYFISFIEYTWPWKVKNISTKRKQITFRRSLTHFFSIWLHWTQLTTESEKKGYTEKSSSIPQVTDTPGFIRFYKYTSPWEVKKYKYTEKSSNIPQDNDTLYFLRFIEYTWPWEVKNISTKRKQITFRRSLTLFSIRLYWAQLTTESEKYQYTEKSSSIPQVNDTLYFIKLNEYTWP
jgi:uncharacterized membrane protein SirB2